MGWYLSYGKTLLVRSGSDVTAAAYHRVLEEPLVSHGRAWYRSNWLLADDNARPYRACVVDAYLHEQDMHHPHGLSPISSGYELSRTYLGQNWSWLEELDPQSVNLWQHIPLERVQTLVSSMPRRVRALVDARGSSTRY